LAHISRKELKKDDFRDTVVHGAEAVLSHWRVVWIIGTAVLLVIAAVLGWWFYSEDQTVKAAAAFEEAMKVFHARIRALGEPQDPAEITYVEDKNKYEDAAKKFTGLAHRYWRTRPGQMARYYAGLSYERLGQYEEAEKWLREAQKGSAELASQARFQLAKVYERSGKGAEAANIYQELIHKPTSLVPKLLAMLALAEYYSKANREEAAKLYEQIKTEFANTAIADEAEQKLEMLRAGA